MEIEGYKMLLVGDGSTVEVDEVPMQEEYEDALEGEIDKKIIKLDDSNELGCEDSMSHIIMQKILIFLKVNAN